MITLTCDFCSEEITLQGEPKEYKKFQKVFNTQYKNENLKITIRVESANKHICQKCGKLAVKSLVK